MLGSHSPKPAPELLCPDLRGRPHRVLVWRRGYPFSCPSPSSQFAVEVIFPLPAIDLQNKKERMIFLKKERQGMGDDLTFLVGGGERGDQSRVEG